MVYLLRVEILTVLEAELLLGMQSLREQHLGPGCDSAKHKGIFLICREHAVGERRSCPLYSLSSSSVFLLLLHPYHYSLSKTTKTPSSRASSTLSIHWQLRRHLPAAMLTQPVIKQPQVSLSPLCLLQQL